MDSNNIEEMKQQLCSEQDFETVFEQCSICCWSLLDQVANL